MTTVILKSTIALCLGQDMYTWESEMSDFIAASNCIIQLDYIVSYTVYTNVVFSNKKIECVEG